MRPHTDESSSKVCARNFCMPRATYETVEKWVESKNKKKVEKGQVLFADLA